MSNQSSIFQIPGQAPNLASVSASESQPKTTSSLQAQFQPAPAPEQPSESSLDYKIFLELNQIAEEIDQCRNGAY